MLAFDRKRSRAESVGGRGQSAASSPPARGCTDTGMADEEGAFLACTCWAVEALAFTGQREAAVRLMEQALELLDGAALLTVMIDPDTGELLGDLPQALSHLALITAATAAQAVPSAASRPETAKVAAMTASVTAVRRRRESTPARATMLTACSASTPTPSRRTAAVGTATVTNAWTSWRAPSTRPTTPARWSSRTPHSRAAAPGLTSSNPPQPARTASSSLIARPAG